MSTTAEAAAQKTALDLRYAQVGLLQMKLRSTDPGAILDELTGKLAIAPRFFQQTAVCLDLNELDGEPAAEELRGVIDAVQRGGVKVVGVAEGPNSAALAKAVDLPVISGFKPQNPAPARAPVTAVAPAPAPQPPPQAQAQPALIHTQPVRSGQRLYARERDLVVIGTVGAGAEVMADGCVHVYGALRGRAMAGVRGDSSARVFTTEFRAELVAVAGVFKVFEQLPAELAGRAVQALLAGEELRFARLDA
ncbi:MAG: septum site-determining protein MinC [Pseudomonadota bacterium]|jgi:septum site-determining protein MinC|nr:MAG: septum site-determining protein MinC [Pseudomonadota bacterium]